MRQPAYRKRIRWKRVIQRPHRKETVTDEDGFWSGESETVESSANGSDGWESAEMDGAEAGDEAVKRDAAAFVSGDVEENRRGNRRDK